MIVLGLTGSIGMGKSTACDMLIQLGMPVHDSDQVARAVMQEGGEAMPAVRAAFPYFEYPQIYGLLKNKGRKIDRRKLANLVFEETEDGNTALAKLEGIIHPLVRQSQIAFIKAMRRAGKDRVVLDIPLLFEKNLDYNVDYTIVVSAPYHVQKSRVMSRPGMSEDDFHHRLQAQMPDKEKRAMADFVVETGLGRAHTMRALKEVLAEIETLEHGAPEKKEKIYDP